MVGYLGPVNSFTYYAAKNFYVENELKAYSNFYLLFQALEEGKVEGIVVPIENSIEGTVNEVNDKILEYGFHISKEIKLDIKLSLISKNIDIKNIKYVISHPHALAQCRQTLNKEIGKYTEVLESSTSHAVEALTNLSDQYGAIAYKSNAFGLNLLKQNIQDYQHNQTRFVFIQKTLEIAGFHNKTSIICAPKIEASGALYDILHEFAIRGINLTRIESRPNKLRLGEYLFFLDIDGNINNPLIKDVLNILPLKTNLLKIVGSFYSKTEKA